MMMNKEIPIKIRNGRDLERMVNFRKIPRKMNISPEDAREQSARFHPPNFKFREFPMGEEWKSDYNPESVFDFERNGLTQRLGEILSLSDKFKERGWTRATYEERVFITARRFLARGVNDGQFLPNQPAYVEFKMIFFNSGEGDWESYQNRIFFVHVRDLMDEIRPSAVKEEYLPWRNRYVDLGLSDSERMNEK